MAAKCLHLNQINKHIQPKTPNGCEECLKSGDTWISLRECLTCGHVGCCDNSKNQHATKHFKKTNHPIIKSVTPNEVFTWCYIDSLMI